MTKLHHPKKRCQLPDLFDRRLPNSSLGKNPLHHMRNRPYQREPGDDHGEESNDLVVFAIWTRPVNFITDDWTVRLADWEALLRQWEYSHAANAGITLTAFCASTLAALHGP